MKIAVKSGVEQLGLFEGESFPCYEAYLCGEENLSDLLKTKMKLAALHMPGAVMISTRREVVDFAQEGEVADACFQKLQDLILFASGHDVMFIIIHLGFFNSLTEKREGVLERVAKRFNRLFETLGDLNVRVCVENVPRWTNICFEHEPLLSDAAHLMVFQKMCPAIGVTLDVDHLAIDTVFGYFESGFTERYILESDKDRFRVMMQEEMMLFTRSFSSLFTQLIEQRLIDFIEKVQPDTVHAVGSDFCQYELVDGKLPLRGEALPLGFNGMIKGVHVEDRIDHAFWLLRLTDCRLITLELYLRADYDYVKMMRDNYDFVSSTLL